jgi:hypothetical protein
VAARDGRAVDPLLEIVANLARHHREHERFYAEAPLESALQLARASRGLKALAERWSVVDPVAPLPSPFAGCPDLNDDRATELLGILFMEGQGEPAELTALKRALRTSAQEGRAVGEWLGQAMEAAWAVAARLVDYPQLADLLAERHRIITTDRQSASLAVISAAVVDRAVDLLDHVDLTPAAVRADLAGERLDARLLFSACELLDHAADLAAHSATLTHENDRRWRVFGERVRELQSAS